MPDTRKQVLQKQFSNPESELTQEEKNALEYHRNNLKSGKYLVQPNGDITTFMGAISNVDGKEMYYPTYWGGKVLEPNEAIDQTFKSGIRFPMYNSVKEAEKRERIIHGIMQSDIDAARKK